MYPQYVEVNNKRYKINTDFRVAIECNRIAEDKTIGDLERGLAVIYALFGDEGIDTPEHYEKLLDLAKKYLLCGKEYDTKRNEKPNMDFIQDYSYITTSFMSDYHIDLDNCEMHWWKFVDLMNGLSNSEFGNCCILNKIRNLRDLDVSTIKDAKTRKQIIEMKKEVALHKDKKVVTQEQRDRAKEIYKKLGIIKEG